MHSVQLTKGLFRNFSAAFFVFFAAAAGTRIIRTDFLFGVSELFGFTRKRHAPFITSKISDSISRKRGTI